jgi:hypothetical protein
MQTNRSIEPPDSAAAACGNGNRAKRPFAKLLSVVRGDRYLADAYESAWIVLMERRAASGHAAPAAPTHEER